MLGDSGVGSKTSLINRIIKGMFTDTFSTSGACFYKKTFDLNNGYYIYLNIWDTPGQEKYRQLNEIFIKDSDYIVLGYDITYKKTFESVKNFWYPMAKNSSGKNLIYLLGNKIDLIEKMKVNEEEVKDYAKNNNIRFFQISCQNETGINDFLSDLLNELTKL